MKNKIVIFVAGNSMPIVLSRYHVNAKIMHFYAKCFPKMRYFLNL